MNWIKIKDELPKEFVEVLIYHRMNTINIGTLKGEEFILKDVAPCYYIKDSGLFTPGWITSYPLDVITHWMPLPQKPNEENYEFLK